MQLSKEQHALVPGALLNEKGELNEAGYAKSLIREYDRKAIKAPALRIKEWDYYCITNDDYAVALTIDDNSYMGLDSISFMDLKSGTSITRSPMQLLTLGKKALPSSSDEGDIYSEGKGYFVSFVNKRSERTITAHMDDFSGKEAIDVDIALYDFPSESMVIATPFAGAPKAFYYNQKINCMRAKGIVRIGGTEYDFDGNDSFGVLDWGRGVWTYSNTWYWSSLSCAIDSIKFGFNLGYGFGDTSAASENMLFFDGKAHKLGKVVFDIPSMQGKDDFMSVWTIKDDEDRLELKMEPILNRSSLTDFKFLKSDQNQVFGRFSGRAVLDDETEVVIRGKTGFAEKVTNKW
ncbi:MAG: DUF2804 domain-containing protein [Eubacteriaceae bacterium]|nr:DUF2804 domain-containing protein [Eubacteriaceae bacterium]